MLCASLTATKTYILVSCMSAPHRFVFGEIQCFHLVGIQLVLVSYFGGTTTRK